MNKKIVRKVAKKTIHKSTKIIRKIHKPIISKKTVPQKKITRNKIINKNNNNSDKNSKKVIVVHGWSGDVSKGWFPWLKKTLEGQGFDVTMEKMPNPEKPEIDVWIERLKRISGKINEQTYFIGHSIGCQTIIRMLEKHESEKVGGAVFLAGWFDLKENTYTENPKSEKESRKIAAPWITKDIDFTKVQSKFPPGTVTAIFSDDDPYVDLNNAETFKKWLDARVIIENGKGHYSEEETEIIPILLEELLRISGTEEDVE
jgi:uncharacterized protein